MIRSSVALEAIVKTGRTIALLEAFEGGKNTLRWTLMDNNETVHGTAVKTLVKAGKLAVIQRDICGDPYQYEAAH